MARRSNLIVLVLAWTAGFLALHWTGSVLPLTAIAMLLSAFYLGRDPELRQLLRPRWRGLGLGVLGAALMLAVTYVCVPVLERASPAFYGQVSGLYRLMASARIWPLSLLVPVTALAEEVLFRGRAQDDLRGKSAVGTVVLSAVFYAAAHVASGSPLLVGVALVCGLYWGALRALGGSLWAPMIAHAVWDVSVFFLMPLVIGG